MWSIGTCYNYIDSKHGLRLLRILLLALLSVGCSAKIQDEAETVRRIISIDADAFPFYSKALAVQSEADVFVFNDDRLRRIDTYQHMKVNSSMVDAVSTHGKKIVSVLVNAKQDTDTWKSIDSFYSLEQCTSDIRKEDPQSPFMYGYSYFPSGSYAVEMPIRPILAKVSLRSISCDFSGKSYEGEQLTDAKVYLTNINAMANILDESGATVRESINVGGLNPSDIASLKSPGMVRVSLPERIGLQKQQVDAEMFCYPNTIHEESMGARFTRMVVEGKIRGITYYWPINVNRGDFAPIRGIAGIGSGCHYVFDMVITRTGSFDPDVPVTAASVQLTYSLKPWEEKEEAIEYF